MLTGWIPVFFKDATFQKLKKLTYGFNQNADVLAKLPPSPLDNFCPSAKHNDSPNTFSIDSAALISSTRVTAVPSSAEIRLALF